MSSNRAVSAERLPIDWQDGHYDLAIGAVGYEARSRHAFEVGKFKSDLKVAAAFTEQQVFEFHANVQSFRAMGFTVEEVPDQEYGDWCIRVIERARRSVLPSLRAIADISSLNRLRLANLLSAFQQARMPFDITVDFIYSLASFTAPIPQDNPNSHVGPVSKEFAGWWTEPDRPLNVIVGLGYEQDRALGAVEYLQAQDVWLFIPRSIIEDYTPQLEIANQSLLKSTEPSHQFVYHVRDPLDCFARLQSLVQGLQTQSNVVLLPFGPKLFVLCCLLVAASDQEIAVWRVSAQMADEPVNRMASGDRYGLRVLFRNSELINTP